MPNESLNIAVNGRLYNEIIENLFISFGSLFTYRSFKVNGLHQESHYYIAIPLDQIRQNTTFNDILSFDEQQRQYELIQAENEFRSRLRTNAFLGSTFTLIVIAFFFYRNNRQKQKAKQKIENAYEQFKNPPNPNSSNPKKWLALVNSLPALPTKFKTHSTL